MEIRKIIVYPKSAMKPIILTDVSDEDIQEVQDNITNMLNDNKISILKTSNDILIVRPSEIQGVLISKKEKLPTDSKYSDVIPS
jgi:predicted DNA-binding ArsR family transcriptional regulator